jgi:RNA polymerase sigma-54 factor
MQRDLEAIVNDLAFSQNISTTADEIRSILELIQQFDPPGVGARNLQECLLIQLRRIEEQTKAIRDAIMVIERSFDEYTKRHYDKIEQKTEISQEDLKAVNAEILKLNPKPGNSLSEVSRANPYIVPDFLITVNEEELILNLNSRNTPELRLNKTYLGMLEEYSKDGKRKKSAKEKEAAMFMKQKLESAQWFINALRQRENTLYQTMFAIMNFQKEYFMTGDESKIKPMILKDIAQVVKLDVSTISRVANSKYVQTPYGIFLLKTFFSEGVQMDSGEEVSAREIKKFLQDCIDGEDKKNPLNDEELTKMLKEKGYTLARRTVAKYREQMDIPVARLRREL